MPTNRGENPMMKKIILTFLMLSIGNSADANINKAVIHLPEKNLVNIRYTEKDLVKRDLELLTYAFNAYVMPKNVKFNQTELCIANTMYFEAKGEPGMIDKFLSGMSALDRARADSELFENTVCEVVAQKAQYSWYPMFKRLKDKHKEKEAWATALAASKVLYMHRDQLRSNILYFHAKGIKPKWSKKMAITYSGTGHYFYS